MVTSGFENRRHDVIEPERENDLSSMLFCQGLTSYASIGLARAASNGM